MRPASTLFVGFRALFDLRRRLFVAALRWRHREPHDEKEQCESNQRFERDDPHGDERGQSMAGAGETVTAIARASRDFSRSTRRCQMHLKLKLSAMVIAAAAAG